MSYPTIRETYDKYEQAEGVDGLGGDIDHLLCEVITRIIEIPEVRQAVILAALRVDVYVKEYGPDTIGDIPFQAVWNHLMTETDTLDEETKS